MTSLRISALTGIAASLLSVASFLAPASAGASYDTLGSGGTRITLAPSFAHLLATHGVNFSATAPAADRGPTATLPLATGSLDPTVGKGELETAGSLIFFRGHRRVILRQVTVKTKPQPLLAKVGGGQLKVASGKLRFTRRGFGSRLIARHLVLTAKFATRLSKKLALHDVFVEGQPFGTLRADGQPATVSVLGGGRVTLAPDPAFIAKLDRLFVSFNPIAPAERASGPIFSLPIIEGGALAPDASTGTLRSGGDLEFLQLGAGQVFWHELWFDLGAHRVLAEVDEEPTPTLPGKLGQIPVASLDLSTAQVVPDPDTRTLSVTGVGLTLDVQSAAVFNEAFAKPQGKTDVFGAGEPFAVASFVAQTH
jgi:hypothetical protein